MAFIKEMDVSPPSLSRSIYVKGWDRFDYSSIIDNSNQVPIKHTNESLSFSDAVTTAERISSSNPENIANKPPFLNAEQILILSIPSQNTANKSPFS